MDRLGGLQPKDSANAYQEDWRLVLADVLASRSADYDFVEMVEARERPISRG